MHDRRALLGLILLAGEALAGCGSQHVAIDGDSDEAADADADVDSDVDADADSDVDSDTDIDADADLDADPDISACELPCDENALYPLCEVGDCRASIYGDDSPLECCVAPVPVCSALVTVEGVVEDLGIEYRGLWDGGFACTLRVLESDGERIFVFEVRSRQVGCEPGLHRIRLVGRLDAITGGRTVPLCYEAAAEGIWVDLFRTDDAYEQFDYTNTWCDTQGELAVAVGETTGQPYELTVRGRLAEVAEGILHTGATIGLTIESRGFVDVEPSE